MARGGSGFQNKTLINRVQESRRPINRIGKRFKNQDHIYIHINVRGSIALPIYYKPTIAHGTSDNTSMPVMGQCTDNDNTFKE
jgi:hypothetical protein